MKPNQRRNIEINRFSPVLGEEMEFVEVNQDECPGNTWDSFESSEFYDNLDGGAQEHFESAATSTTKTMKFTPNNGSI